MPPSALERAVNAQPSTHAATTEAAVAVEVVRLEGERRLRLDVGDGWSITAAGIRARQRAPSRDCRTR